MFAILISIIVCLFKSGNQKQPESKLIILQPKVFKPNQKKFQYPPHFFFLSDFFYQSFIVQAHLKPTTTNTTYRERFFWISITDQYLCLRMPARHALQMFSGTVGNISECTLRSVMDSSSPCSTDMASVVKRLHMRCASTLPFSLLARPVAQSQPFQQMAMEGLQLGYCGVTR